MSHRLYTTEGLILAAHDYGEANGFYQVLTPDLGLIGASAQGVRHLKSKLRPQLGSLGHAKLTLVRGRQVWRLVGAESSGLLAPVLNEVSKQRAWARVALLVRRLIRGEAADARLYDDLLAGLVVLSKLESARVADFEAIMVLRLLNSLGYVRESVQLMPWLAADLWPSQASLALTLPELERERVISVINYGLEHSQL